MITDRRHVLAALGSLFPGAALGQSGMTRVTAFAFVFTGLDGEPIRLMEHAGRPILIVNTASRCGYTPQYRGLQELWTRFRDRGLLVVGVPSNDFGGQEPGDRDEILKTAKAMYGVTFPLAAKTDMRGAQVHPFYRWSASERPLELPSWNFHKYLIGRDGRIAASFRSDVDPTDPRMIAAIERELGGG